MTGGHVPACGPSPVVLGRPILVGNPSIYLRYVHSAIPEWALLVDIVRRTVCCQLCDANNIYVSAGNHGWNPRGRHQESTAQSGHQWRLPRRYSLF
ncbi:DUF692 family multinuclear iron-containing protein [Burkholderia ubonensis]|uniref:multinuclear nonheme iron-dependent oxidase n=1 Tax=Burkholderia ubonensis TaxID=101571 RepID=UPI002FC9846E